MAEYDVVVVGAGFAGVYCLHQLKTRGFRARGLERGGGVGGTWFWNRYPGARCDVDSLDYQFSDAALAREWKWPETYASQPDVLRYLEHAAQRWGVLQDIDFNTELVAAEWDAGASRWSLRTSAGASLLCRFFVMATGVLSCPKDPQFEGLGRFQGQVLHTSRWPEEHVDFTGKRVAVIGTGSSGVQSAPVLAKQAAQLYVLQRTANYAIPARVSPVDPKLRKLVTERWEEFRGLAREDPFGGHVHHMAPTVMQSALAQKPAELRSRFEAAWERGGLALVVTFRDLLRSWEANRTASDFVRSKISETVSDPGVAALLQPDYALGCRRICADSGYYEMFNRPNVQLVDVKGKDLEFLPDGVRVGGQTLELDAVVLATGFDSFTGALLKPDIRGAEGLSLRDHWRAGARTCLGLQVAGFPNLFMCTGPHSPSLVANMPLVIELHVDWIVGCLEGLRGRGLAAIEARRDAEAAWTGGITETVNCVAPIFLGDCGGTTYTGGNIPGKPTGYLPYAGSFGQYRAICNAEQDSGYPSFVLRKEDGQVVGPSVCESFMAFPRKVAYRLSNAVAILRMMLGRGGKDSLAGAAWPDAKIREQL